MRSSMPFMLWISFCLLSSSYALPFLSHEETHLLQPRAKYAVVAVDGSTNESSGSSASPPDTPVNPSTQSEIQIKTVTATPTAPTVSIVTLIATKTVVPIAPPEDRGKSKANVAIVNVGAAHSSLLTTTSSSTTSIPTASSAAVTAQPTKPSCSSTPRLSVASSTGSSTIGKSTSSTWTPSLRPTSSIVPTSFSSPSPTPSVSREASYDLSSPPIITPSSTTSKTYDDGFWHTTYRVWNATLSSNVPMQPSVSNPPLW